MNNGLGYKLANVPTITGLSSVTADSVTSDVTNTSQLFINGVDVSTVLVQVPINTANITILQQLTTGISYSDIGSIDLTTIDNNVTITSGKKLKCATTATTNDDVANKLFVDTAIANLVDSAPATLDTLNELAAALGDDPNFATTVTNLIAGKVSLTTNETISGAKIFTQPLTVNTTTPFGVTSALIVKDSSNNSINFIPSAGAGAYNFAVGNGDSLIFSGNTENTRTLTLTTHSTTFSGVRITPTSVLMGAGSSSSTPSSSVLCSGNSVVINGYTSMKNQMTFNSTIFSERQINNTYYNLFDNIDGVTGTYRGRIYTTPSTCFLDLSSLTHTFRISNSAAGTTYYPFIINPTDLTISTTNCPTITGFTLPGTGDSTSKIATTQWVQSALSAGPFTGITYSDAGGIDLTTIDNNLTISSGKVLTLNGINVSSAITSLQTATTGITYSDAGAIDLTTIDNNLTISSGKVLTVNGINVSNAITATTGISYSDAGAIDLTTIDNNLKITKNTSALQFSVGSGLIIDPVAGNNSGFISQNTGSSSTIIQNQATSGLIQLAVRNASNTLTNALQLSTSDCTITTTNNPTITGFTDPASSDSTNNIASTRWVQSALTAGTGAASTVFVTGNNTATTHYPIFTTITAGQKSLLFDTTTTALSYVPSTSTLGASVFRATGNLIANNGGGTTHAISIGSGGTVSNGCLILTNPSNPTSTTNFAVTEAGNTVIGLASARALLNTNFNNTMIGYNVSASSTGYGNTCIGVLSGSNITTGFLNTCIGYDSSVPSVTGNNQVGIGSTSDTIYIRGGFNFRVGTLITGNITLPTGGLPLAQHYPVAMASASQTITLPAPTLVMYLGAIVTFKRRTNTTAFTIAAGAGTPFLTTGSITPSATFAFGTGFFQLTLMADGLNWCAISQS
jgi:hypothetical protein